MLTENKFIVVTNAIRDLNDNSVTDARRAA